ncbi:S26 family signal peptidase [Pseudomonas aeruginosa]|uniref:S26 family signal peptidase n=1 Tax=Pseudomonas aeruginosa TaxID=287 RepID=UPI001E5D7EBC|nr:S26 family signal peptidase [Pseudomonas aeruginosa]MCC9289593.1 S26 family signal peptidase [Pseudomonas aeruginosa]UVN18841.1 F-type type IV secretion, inner-membrane component of translocation channel [Pseudomonas aeruginosa]
MALSKPFSIEAKVRRALAKVERDRARKRLSAGFLGKGLLISAVVAGSVVLLASRYSIAMASQDSVCLRPYRLWIIDKMQDDLVRGEIYAFHCKGLSPILADGTIIVEVLEGMPGDRGKVTLDETTINGVCVGIGLQVASQHGIDPQKYVREGEIGAGGYWFFGRTPDSYDSRYWGSASTDLIIGMAYPIW